MVSSVSPSPSRHRAACSLALRQHLVLAGRQRDPGARQPILEPLERLEQPGLAALQEQERIDERAEPARLDQRLARQSHQPREALRRHSHNPVGRLRGTGALAGAG